MFIAGVSMVTAVGGDALMTAAAVKAGVSAIQESPYFNKRFEPIKMASVPEGALATLDPDVADRLPALSAREMRLLRLSGGAFSDEMREAVGGGPITVLLAGPEDLFPGRVDVMGPSFMQALAQQLAIDIHVNTSRRFAIGRAGVIKAIDYAFQYMDATGVPRVLLGAVDTYRDHGLLGVLDAQDRLLAPGVPDGFAPGEAAVFLLLSRSSEKPGNGVRQVHLSRPGLGQ